MNKEQTLANLNHNTCAGTFSYANEKSGKGVHLVLVTA